MPRIDIVETHRLSKHHDRETRAERHSQRHERPFTSAISKTGLNRCGLSNLNRTQGSGLWYGHVTQRQQGGQPEERADTR
ncbi:MAG: hypothetical protein MZV65_22375 [Chromatiales bacterium]|nr:hypothetical protein [Chromatiales bacterium]